MECCKDCNITDVFNCNSYLDIADKYVDFAMVGSKCEESQKDKLLWYGMGFWLLQDSLSASDITGMLSESLIETSCLENDCDTIKSFARLLGQNCIWM